MKIEGVEACFDTASIVTEIFKAMVRRHAFNVSELGLTYFLRAFADDPSPFLALPVFPNRAFCHSAIYASTASGIERPEQLTGRTIGELALYGHNAGVMPKGVRADEFGFRPERNRWIVGGIDFSMEPIAFVPQPRPAGVEVARAPKGTDLGALLEAGEIDALISADVPRCMLEGSSRVRRLFADHEAVERDYFQRTGIFPILHAVVITRELAEREPDPVRAVYRGFCDAKAAAVEELAHGMTFNNMGTMVPWLTDLLARDRELLGADWWPYGIGLNRVAINSVLCYHYEQGLTARRVALEEVFVPYLLET